MSKFGSTSIPLSASQNAMSMQPVLSVQMNPVVSNGSPEYELYPITSLPSAEIARAVAMPWSGNVPGTGGAAPSLSREYPVYSRPILAFSHSSSALSRLHAGFSRWWPFYVMLAPGLIFFLIWHYVPIWQAKMAFEQVRIIPPNIWIGLKNFQLLFASPVFYQAVLNTLIISGMKILFVFPIPIIVALLLNEVRSGGLRKWIQSAIYLPHFLSWVVIAGVFIAILSPSDGAVNQITGFFGAKPVAFMTDGNSSRWVLVFSEIWRSAG